MQWITDTFWFLVLTTAIAAIIYFWWWCVRETLRDFARIFWDARSKRNDTTKHDPEREDD